MDLCVIKVGGSLYDLPDLADRLRLIVAQRAGCCCLLFPGGGAAADLVRESQQRHQFSDDDAHHLAIAALSWNARLLSTLLPGTAVVSDLDAIASADAGSPSLRILDPQHPLEALERQFPDDAPPHVWDVTSDSLAAWLAVGWHARELILLKSIPAPSGIPVTRVMQHGGVDPYFPGLAGRLPRLSWCAARETPPTIQPWLVDGAPVVATTAAEGV